jgi:hypothetical protein
VVQVVQVVQVVKVVKVAMVAMVAQIAREARAALTYYCGDCCAAEESGTRRSEGPPNGIYNESILNEHWRNAAGI